MGGKCEYERKFGRAYSHRAARFREVITDGVAAYLSGLYEALATEVKALEAGEPAPVAPSIVAGLEAQAVDLRTRRNRLLTLYETGRIDLDGFDQRAVEIDQALEGVLLRIDQERRAVESEAGRTVRLAALEDLLPVIGERLAAVEPAAGNRWLREMIERVEIDDRQVTGVRLRW